MSIHWGLSLGGVAKYATTLERVGQFISIKIRSLCVMPEGRVVDQEALSSLDAVILPVRSVFDLSWLKHARRVISVENPDCLLSHGFNGHLVSLISLPHKMNVPRLATYHGSYHATTSLRKLLSPVHNGFTHWFLRRKATAILSVADHCKDFLAKKGVDAQKITVVHNGIPDYQPETSVRDRVRKELGLSADQILIGTASRLDPVKGIKHLLDAFKKVNIDNPQVYLVIMGDGSAGAILRQQAISLGVQNRVRFTGIRSDVSRFLTGMDIFALPSLAEYHSIGLIEAMRAGLAIVATNVGGNTESVRNKQEGLIVSPADPDGMAVSLIKLVHEPELRSRLGKAARKRYLAEFSEESMLRKTASWLATSVTP